MRILPILLCLPLSAAVPKDKAMHAAAGAVAYVTGYEVAKAAGSEHPKAWGIATALTAGIAKEAYDRRHPKTHTCDRLDAAATLAGGVAISFVWRW